MYRILCVALSVLAVSVMMFAVPYAANGAKDPATLGLDWLPIGNHVGIFAAQDKGFYARENLDLNIKRGFGSSDTVKRIGAGESDFGHADIANAVVGRSRGLPVKWTAPGLLDTRVRVFDLMRPPQLERVFPALPGPAFGSRSPRESNDGCTGS